MSESVPTGHGLGVVSWRRRVAVYCDSIVVLLCFSTVAAVNFASFFCSLITLCLLGCCWSGCWCCRSLGFAVAAAAVVFFFDVIIIAIITIIIVILIVAVVVIT